MKRNHPRNHSPHHRSNSYRQSENHHREFETYRPHVQHIRNNVNISLDMRSDAVVDNEDNKDGANNLSSITTRNHQDHNYNYSNSSTRRSQGHNTSSSTNNQGNGHLWNHPRRPRYSSEFSTGQRGDNRMQRGCPNGTRRSESETSDNNLNSSRSPSGMSGPNGSSMVNPTEAEIVSKTKCNWPKSNSNWPRSNNWHITQPMASIDTPPTNGTLKCRDVEYLQDNHTHNTVVIDDDIKTVSNVTMQQTEAETYSRAPLVTTSITTQSIIVPLVESNYMPQMLELERDARNYHKSFPSRTGPQLALGLSVSNSVAEKYQKELAVVIARNLAIRRLPSNLIIIPDDSESDPSNETDEVTELTATHTTNQEESHLYKFSEAVKRCQQVTLAFVQENQTWDQIKCPCSSSMVDWMRDNRCVIDTHSTERCQGTTFTPQGFLDHCVEHSSTSYHHYFIMKYLQRLYCTDTGILRPCIPNPYPRSGPDNLMILNLVRRISLLSYMRSI